MRCGKDIRIWTKWYSACLKTRYLLKGSNGKSSAIVRNDASNARTPSFWVESPYPVVTMTDVAGYDMALRTRARPSRPTYQQLLACQKPPGIGLFLTSTVLLEGGATRIINALA